MSAALHACQAEGPRGRKCRINHLVMRAQCRPSRSISRTGREERDGTWRCSCFARAARQSRERDLIRSRTLPRADRIPRRAILIPHSSLVRVARGRHPLPAGRNENESPPNLRRMTIVIVIINRNYRSTRLRARHAELYCSVSPETRSGPKSVMLDRFLFIVSSAREEARRFVNAYRASALKGCCLMDTEIKSDLSLNLRAAVKLQRDKILTDRTHALIRLHAHARSRSSNGKFKCVFLLLERSINLFSPV